MFVVVGLGNPGQKYEGTRHNIGFAVVDALARRHGAPPFQSKFKGAVATCRIAGEAVVLLKPLTFMNLSADAVQPAVAFYKVALEDLVVVHDDLDLDLGQLKLKKGGGHGGHNGIRHIAGRLGPGFLRVRAGIGRPGEKRGVSSHVLSKFAGQEVDAAALLVERAADAVETLLSEGLLAAQNRFQTKKKKKPKPKPDQKAPPPPPEGPIETDASG